jgi:hypothetical protein
MSSTSGIEPGIGRLRVFSCMSTAGTLLPADGCGHSNAGCYALGSGPIQRSLPIRPSGWSRRMPPFPSATAAMAWRLRVRAEGSKIRPEAPGLRRPSSREGRKSLRLCVTAARPSRLATSKTTPVAAPAEVRAVGNSVKRHSLPCAGAPRSAVAVARPGSLSRAQRLLACGGCGPATFMLGLLEHDPGVNLVPKLAGLCLSVPGAAMLRRNLSSATVLAPWL